MSSLPLPDSPDLRFFYFWDFSQPALIGTDESGITRGFVFNYHGASWGEIDPAVLDEVGTLISREAFLSSVESRRRQT